MTEEVQHHVNGPVVIPTEDDIALVEDALRRRLSGVSPAVWTSAQPSRDGKIDSWDWAIDTTYPPAIFETGWFPVRLVVEFDGPVINKDEPPSHEAIQFLHRKHVKIVSLKGSAAVTSQGIELQLDLGAWGSEPLRLTQHRIQQYTIHIRAVAAKLTGDTEEEK